MWRLWGIDDVTMTKQKTSRRNSRSSNSDGEISPSIRWRNEARIAKNSPLRRYRMRCAQRESYIALTRIRRVNSAHSSSHSSGESDGASSQEHSHPGVTFGVDMANVDATVAESMHESIEMDVRRVSTSPIRRPTATEPPPETPLCSLSVIVIVIVSVVFLVAIFSIAGLVLMSIVEKGTRFLNVMHSVAVAFM